MVSERRLLKWAVLKMWTPRQGSPRDLGLAVAQLSVPIGILIAFGSPCHSRPKRQRIENQIDFCQKTLTEQHSLANNDAPVLKSYENARQTNRTRAGNGTARIGHCVILRGSLYSIWGRLMRKLRAKIAQFANEYGSILKLHKQGCVRFEKEPQRKRRT